MAAPLADVAGAKLRVRCRLDESGAWVPTPDAAAALDAHRHAWQEQHPELVRPAKSEQERNELTARRLTFAASFYRPPVQASHALVVQRGSSRESRPARRNGRTCTTASGSDPPRTEGDDEPPPPADSVVRACAGCGAPLDGRRPQTRTCSDACKQRAYRQRLARLDGGASNGNGRNGNGAHPALDDEGRRWLSTDRGRRWLADQIARTRLERAAGFAKVERYERDLDRALAKRERAA